MNLGLRRIDGRLLWVISTVIVILTMMTLYAQNLVDRSASQSLSLIQNSSVLTHSLSAIKTTIQHVESGIYQYATEPREHQEKDILLRLNLLNDQLDSLLQVNALKGDPDSYSDVKQMQSAVQRLEIATGDFFLIMGNVERRYPGMPILLQLIEPTNRKFSEAVELALQEGAMTDTQPHLLPKDQYQILQLFQEIRYAWSQMVSWIRVFVANRMGAFGDPEISMQRNLINRKLFADKVNLLLSRIEKYDQQGLLELQQSESLLMMKEAARFYENNIGKAIDLYLSDDWRADIAILLNDIVPAINDINGYIAKTEQRIKAYSTSSLTSSQGVAILLSRFIWIFTSAIGGLLVIAYVVFQKSVRKPIMQVSKALEAEAQGKPMPVFQESRLTEINQLVNAFNGMRDQVHSRQKRLQSILSNAAEGIITIDQKGKIETYNKAAETLFEYSPEEILGQNVSILATGEHRYYHDEYMRAYLTSGEKNIIGKDREVMGRRKDGSTFPMSLKVSEMQLGDKKLFTAIVDDISERNAVLEHLRHLAEHDALTGLYNRQFFLNELDRMVAQSIREKDYRYACVYIDLDNFKYVNDAYGHLAGDKLLQEVTDIFKQRTRKSDLLCRLGGDEFALLFIHVEPWQAKQAADQYREAIASYTFSSGGKPVDVGCSIGVALMSPEIDNKETLLANADIACNIAKNSGRNCVHVFKKNDMENITNLHADMGWSARIKEALEHNRFEFALQPIATTYHLELAAYEALIRIRDPNTRELIMPSGFLGAAERFGLMVDIDCWMIKNAIKTVATQFLRHSNVMLSINLSAKSIGQQKVLDSIKDALVVNDFSAGQLIFEITEDVAIADLNKAIDFIAELRRLGCKTALDDFGVGYCSFSYLKDLPVDFIKIDGSFIRSISDDNVNYAVVKAITDIAHTANIKTVAEFVENKHEYQLLKQIGIDYIQGYFIGRPVMADKLLQQNVIDFPHGA